MTTNTNRRAGDAAARQEFLFGQNNSSTNNPTAPRDASRRPRATSYVARHISRRRATKTEVEQRRQKLFDIVEQMRPMTVRQVFYQATIRDIVEKTEVGYTKVQNDLALMRKAGDLPYDWLADNTRWPRKPRTYSGIEEALQDAAWFYRKSLWTNAEVYVEIWLEKDALAGVIYEVTGTYDVPLMVARGYASLSFLHGAAEHINTLDVPAYIYHLGDFDPSGVNASEKIEETLRELAPSADIVFERIAVTPEQINDWNLPSRPTKASDSRAKNFGSVSVELDAIEPQRLRDLVQDAIAQHLPPKRFAALKAAEARERKKITELIARFA
jgi:hypothetical protein